MATNSDAWEREALLATGSTETLLDIGAPTAAQAHTHDANRQRTPSSLAPYPSLDQHLRRIPVRGGWWRGGHLIDWLLTFILLSASFAVRARDPWRQYIIDTTDPSISAPHIDEEYIPLWAAWFASIGIPIVGIVLFRLLTLILGVFEEVGPPSDEEKKKGKGQNWVWKSRVGGCRVVDTTGGQSEACRRGTLPWLAHDFHHAILGVLLAVGFAALSTNLIKIWVGRPRPDFMARCGKYDPETQTCSSVSSTFITNLSKAEAEEYVREGYLSFPSGHAARSMAGLGFLSMYLIGKLGVLLFETPPFDGRSLPLTISVSPIFGALYIGVSRIHQHVHHWDDVVVGFLFGLLSAYIAYRTFYPPLTEQHPIANVEVCCSPPSTSPDPTSFVMAPAQNTINISSIGSNAVGGSGCPKGHERDYRGYSTVDERALAPSTQVAMAAGMESPQVQVFGATVVLEPEEDGGGEEGSQCEEVPAETSLLE